MRQLTLEGRKRIFEISKFLDLDLFTIYQSISAEIIYFLNKT